MHQVTVVYTGFSPQQAQVTVVYTAFPLSEHKLLLFTRLFLSALKSKLLGGASKEEPLVEGPDDSSLSSVSFSTPWSRF